MFEDMEERRLKCISTLSPALIRFEKPDSRGSGHNYVSHNGSMRLCAVAPFQPPQEKGGKLVIALMGGCWVGPAEGRITTKTVDIYGTLRHSYTRAATPGNNGGWMMNNRTTHRCLVDTKGHKMQSSVINRDKREKSFLHDKRLDSSSEVLRCPISKLVLLSRILSLQDIT